MRFLVIYNGPPDPDSGSSGTVCQTNAALRKLGHEIEEVFEDDIGRAIPHGNLHYAFELPSRILKATKARLAKASCDVVLISQPYGYLVGKWLRGLKNAPLYLHRSHGHELAVASRIDPWRNVSVGLTRPWWKESASRLLSARLRRQARLGLKYADGTIVPSSYDRDFLVRQEGVDARKVRCIFHATTPAYLESLPRPYTKERHNRLLYVGNLSRIKGGEILWKTGTAILRRLPKLSLTIVTRRTDHSRALSGFGRDVADRIHLLDWMPQDALLDVYDQHGLQIIPSLYEGASKAHYEGMSRGLCLVCSSVGAMRDSITSGENGFLVRPGDPDAFVASLSSLVENFAMARSISNNARKRSAEFTWDRTASEIVAFAADLMSEKSKATYARGIAACPS